MAPSMTAAMPSAATRVKRPTARPRGPRNSAMMVSTATGDGTPDFGRKSRVPLKPEPPNQPSTFCAPWANITTASVSLSTRGTTSPWVETSHSSTARSSCCRCRLLAGRRSHEFRADRVRDRLRQDAIDGRARVVVETPTEHILDRRELIGPPGAPERDRRPLIQDPANRQRQDVLAVALAGQAIERGDRVEILPVPSRLELRIRQAKVIAGEPRV